MCLDKFGDKMGHRELEWDYTVFKVMVKCTDYEFNGDSLPAKIEYFTSPTFPTQKYQIGDTMYPKTKLSVDTLDKQMFLGEGVIHSCLAYQECFERYDFQLSLYSFPNIKRCIVKCTIPKGTPYWVSTDGEDCASTKLVLKEVVLMED